MIASASQLALIGWVLVGLVVVKVEGRTISTEGPLHLVESINQTESSGEDAGSEPRDGVALNGFILFSAEDGEHGRELWRSDGSELWALPLEALPRDCIDCASVTPSPGPLDCPGDCNGDRIVSADEYQLCFPLIPTVPGCCDVNQDGTLAISELIQITNVFLTGCPGGPTPTPIPTPTVVPLSCRGDCDRDGSVSIAELVSGVLSLLQPAVSPCPALDANRDDRVSVDELVASVVASLSDCSDDGAIANPLLERCLAAATEGDCRRASGRWTYFPISGRMACQCPTGQGQIPCRTTSDCVGPCVAALGSGFDLCEGVEVGKCSDHLPRLDCWCDLVDSGAHALCNDP